MEKRSTENDESGNEVTYKNLPEEENDRIGLSNRKCTSNNSPTGKISKVAGTEEDVLQNQDLTNEEKNYQMPKTCMDPNNTLFLNTQESEDSWEFPEDPGTEEDFFQNQDLTVEDNNYQIPKGSMDPNNTLLLNTQELEDNSEQSPDLSENNIIISCGDENTKSDLPPGNSALDCISFKCSRKKSKRHACEICGKIFDERIRLENHKERKCGILKLYACKICNKTFCHKKSLVLHEKNIHTESRGEHECKLCNKIYNTEYSLHIHNKRCKRKPFLVGTPQTCHICQKTLRTKESLKSHMKRSHDPSEKFICAYCDKVFPYKTILIAHIQSHFPASFECKVCKKSYMSQAGLYNHMKNHSDQKDHRAICETCGKDFKSKLALATHLLIHSDEKKFVCEVCGKPFRTDSNLAQHSVTHSDRRPFGCVVCDKAFRIRNHLKQHMAVHGMVNTSTNRARKTKCD